MKAYIIRSIIGEWYDFVYNMNYDESDKNNRARLKEIIKLRAEALKELEELERGYKRDDSSLQKITESKTI